MNNVQKGVLAFHQKFRCDIGFPAPRMVRSDILLLRSRLILEEAAEFVTAASNQDMVEMCDALADLLYVTYGAAVALGVNMEPISNAVQESNMSKDGELDSGGKVKKGPNFFLPDIRGELRKQGWEDN